MPLVKRVILVGVLLSLSFMFPNYGEDDDKDIWDQYNNINNSEDGKIPVMTFNMRLDAEERDPDNHFTKRISRIRKLFSKANPWIIGLQEPFGGQLHHLQSELSPKYKAVGFQRNKNDQGHPSRHNDFITAILYNEEKLELLEQDYIWLSKTPRVPDTKDWDSLGIRTLNIARLKIKNGIHKGEEIIAFNTHLDVKGEMARREQSKIINSVMKEWKEKHPNAAFFLFGDFNSAPGQAAYTTLTQNLEDSWVICNNDSSCTSQSFAISFHGWTGTLGNTYGARLLLPILFSLHGWGLNLPLVVPYNLNTWAKAFINIFTVPPQFSLREAIPQFPWNRFHVDWILYQSPIQSTGLKITPKFVAVMDVRNTQFSSDHYPILGVFEFSK